MFISIYEDFSKLLNLIQNYKYSFSDSKFKVKTKNFLNKTHIKRKLKVSTLRFIIFQIEKNIHRKEFWINIRKNQNFIQNF